MGAVRVLCLWRRHGLALSQVDVRPEVPLSTYPALLIIFFRASSVTQTHTPVCLVFSLPMSLEGARPGDLGSAGCLEPRFDLPY